MEHLRVNITQIQDIVRDLKNIRDNIKGVRTAMRAATDKLGGGWSGDAWRAFKANADAWRSQAERVEKAIGDFRSILNDNARPNFGDHLEAMKKMKLDT
ncbi:MAG: WXG100 family type VII secretion target [Clostridia bacterium]|nr:WXG100 family type VII secretion target [Clostridia bacterium]